MAQIITASPDPEAPDKKTRLVRLNDVHRTESQVRVLCSILEQTEGMCHSFTDTGQSYEQDKRVREAAVTTYELAATQLRNIIDEQSRWNLRDSDGDRYTEQLAEANLVVARRQEALILEKSRPCYSLGAKIRQIRRQSDGALLWIAFLGSEPRNDSLLGVGATAAEALANFDRAFTARAEDSAPPTPGPASEAKTPKKSKKKKHD